MTYPRVTYNPPAVKTLPLRREREYLPGAREYRSCNIPFQSYLFGKLESPPVALIDYNRKIQDEIQLRERIY